MDLTILEALEITTQETKEYIDEQPVISYGETQFLNAASRMTAKNNVGVFVGSDEPVNALDGDIWIDTDKNVGSSGSDASGPSVNIELDDTLTVAGMAADAKAVGDALSKKISTINNIKPDENGNVTIEIPTPELPAVTEEDNGAVLGVSDGEWNKVNLPITVSDDGYTEIEGLRKVTAVNAVKNDTTVVVTATYEGGITSESVITLDSEGTPISIVKDGVTTTLTWEGFDE